MSDLTNTPLAVNSRKTRGFSNFNSRNVEFYTVYFLPKNSETFLDDYSGNVQNNEFAQIVSTIAFAGIELFFLGEPANLGMGGFSFTIGVNSDTSNMGDAPGNNDPYPTDVSISLNLTGALQNAGWPSFVVKMVVDHDSIHSPFVGG